MIRHGGRLIPGRDDDALLGQAVRLSQQCPPCPSAFSVGCLVVAEDGTILVSGFSRQDGTRVHAEEAALRGLSDRGTLAAATLYSSLEPCGERASARTPCAELIIASGLRRVVIAWREPALFVAHRTGLARLIAAGIDVRHLEQHADAARQVNKHLTLSPGAEAWGRLALPRRTGPVPLIITRMPPEQLSQNSPAEWQECLVAAVEGLRGVRVGSSLVCQPGSRAFHLDSWLALGPPGAFLAGTEFAHIHPEYDGSVHLLLPPEVAPLTCELGWAVSASPAGTFLVLGPRDSEEVAAVLAVLKLAYAFARGTTGP